MEKQVQFRDRQELQSGDLSNIGVYAQEALDRIVGEGLTDEKKYTGFSIAKTGATQITIDAGTYWTGGKRYIREEATNQDFLSNLPLLTKRIAAVLVVNADVDTEVEPRDFLIDVETGATEPQSVAMQKLRYAQFQTQFGIENASPQKPTVSTDVLVIGWVTLNTTGVESIEMATDNEFMSIKKLDARATELEEWKGQAGEQITTLGTDITGLASRLAQSADTSQLTRVFEDVARIKELLELKDNYSGYGADSFLNYDLSWSDNSQVGYYAKVEEGIRFADANALNTAITLFNPIDPSVSVASNGLCLPKYSQVRRISVDSYRQPLSISQYQFQTVAYKQMAMSVSRIRYGSSFSVCTNSEFWRTGRYDSASGVFTDRLGRTYQFESGNPNKNHQWVRLKRFWYDTETVYYEKRVATDFSVNGSMVAQTFLNTQGGWLTSLDLFFTDKDASGNVTVLLTKTDAGRPDLTQVVAETTLQPANIIKGSSPSVAAQWTRVSFVPTALAAGERYAIVLVTGGNHFVGLASGVAYAAGTLFYSTDGAFFQGDLTLDMMFRANFASFENPRLEVDLGSINLSGGITDIDIAYEGIVPDGCTLAFEVRPQGSPTWRTISELDTAAFNGLPALCSFRAVFVGTKDLMPGFKLTGSSVLVSRPATNMLHFSGTLTMPAPTRSIQVIAILDYFKEANHDFTVALIDVTNANAVRTAATVVDELLDDRGDDLRHIRRTFTFNATSLPVNTSAVRIRSTGAALAATEVFHVERMTFLSF
ncbi:hypothetical protein J2045_003335 [Peteryoungia aggregata LMG 23059]|uniref:Tail fiber protein n=1 Tax=Peteryoungia aggregata LMG 23059 TaxID=1368425 RepID=A0ABU0GCE7_9HYPH|nr:hypothetical protein [Peteryoungia aggregata]MDQ0422287.1 hypothetical protein [Peteryoungia aggregata LMG 23059]